MSKVTPVGPHFNTVAIVGVGLIGGSLGIALRERGLARRVIGITRRKETIAEALSAGAIDEGTTDRAAVAEAELVYLAPPVLTMLTLTEALAPHLCPGTLVTDAGSTKAVLMEEIPKRLPAGVDFIGGHPMAGSEKGGVQAALGSLFEGAVWVLTRGPNTLPENMERLTAMVRAVGAQPVELDPHLHDDAVARVSHLPHILAAALAQAAGEGEVPAELLGLLVAGGFKSTTRIASSPPDVWRDICLTNRQAILTGLIDLEAAVTAFRAALVASDGNALLEAFQRGKSSRDTLVPPG